MMPEAEDRLRIAIDTNVLVAALTKSSGAAARIVNAWDEDRLEVVSSEATLREAELILDSQWLRRIVPRGRIDALLDLLWTRSIRVRATPIKDLALKDEGDRRLVEAAIQGGASYLITADAELLKYRGYLAAEFIKPTEFLKLFQLDAAREP
jgi:putative PIN family toxin of toxin-antitoxin system